MAHPATWTSLQTDSDVIPRLLVKRELAGTGYVLQVSDLSRVWEERLSKPDIIRRAVDDGCSIDLTEDDQFPILLEKINAALNEEDGTRIDLRPGAQISGIQLDIAAPLPAPFPIFRWTFHMSQLSSGAVGSDIVSPLLRQARDLQHQVQQLVEKLAQKDKVISQCTAKLEETGISLCEIFPKCRDVQTHRRKSQRDQLAHKVDGLGDFDFTAWRAALGRGGQPILSPKALDVLLQESTVYSRGDDKSQWWQNFECSSVSLERKGRMPRTKVAGHPETSKHVVREREHSVGSEKSQKEGNHVEHDAPTPSTHGGESDLEDDRIRTTATNDKESVESDVVGSTATKGRSQRSDYSAASSASNPRSSTKHRTVDHVLERENSEVDSGTDENRVASTGRRPTDEPKRKIGMFGRRRDAEFSEAKGEDKMESNPVAEAIVQDNAHGQRSPKAKPALGKVHMQKGKRGAEGEAENRKPSSKLSKQIGDGDEALALPTDKGEHGRGAAAQPEAEQIEEEPPDRKRERLKRELEDQTTAPVKKKKRKF